MVSLATTNRPVSAVVPKMAGSSLKRKQTDASSSPAPEPTATGQAKRRRVTFDPEVDVRVLADPNEKSLELVGEEVRRAIEKHATGERAAYDGLKALFRESPTSASAPLSHLLQKYVIALTNNTPLLDSNCKGLVHAVIDCKWIARNDDFVRSFQIFLRRLLSVQAGYMSTILQMLVDMFLGAPSPNARQTDDPPIQRVHIQARVHQTLKSILRYSPMASSFLSPIISNTFPISHESAKLHVEFIRNIFTVTEYAPEIRGEILALVTDKLCKIDAQMQMDMDDMDDDLEERSLDPEEQRLKDIRDMMLKLDIVMDLQFSYYASIFDKRDVKESDRMYETLLAQFQSIIIPTYRSRHAQFVLFHFSQLSPHFMELFPAAPTSPASSSATSSPLYARSSSASAPRTSPSAPARISVATAPTTPSRKRSSTPFCFRWRDLIVTTDGKLPSDTDIMYHDGDFLWHGKTLEILRRNIFCKLNPLRICAPDIVKQFGRIAKHLRFTYVDSLVETNKRVRLSRSVASSYLTGIGGRETALTGKKGEEAFLMDAYFPFDPL
ncbi:Ribosomal DNA transcription factor Rrn3 [Pyrenophora tritici-repentis]|nr:Ribosomal DNA transcription factor Rrn3 [Pyrenophora tritici-repentis]